MALNPRTWIELSRGAARHNLRVLQTLTSHGQIMAVVKSNAYGHGLKQYLSLLKNSQIWGVGVAYGEEALEARKLGFQGRIVALSAWEKGQLRDLVAQDVEVCVHDFTTLQLIRQLAGRGAKVRFHLKLDSGTSRIGFITRDLPKLRAAVSKLPRAAQMAAMFTHFANAEDATSTRTVAQWQAFEAMLSKISNPKDVHAACTAAVLRYPQTHGTVVRPGIGLYGIWPSTETKHWAARHEPSIKLQPVLSWLTRVQAVKKIPAGTAVGYGSTFRYKKSGTLGILPIGYGDGFHRSIGNQGWVVVRGQRVPVIGRVCMNLTMIDLSKLRRPRVGDQVELIGPHITVEDHARWAGTISYEILTGLPGSLTRIIVP